MEDLAGKRIVIGGGASGIGAALALRLLDIGAHVVVGDLNAEALDAFAPALKEKPGRAVCARFDLSDDASIERLADRCVEEFGGIDGLAATAAYLSPRMMEIDRPVPQMDPQVWETAMRINVTGHAVLMKAVIPHMIAAGGGAIVTIGSQFAHMGQPYLPAYASSKVALGALVRHVATTCGEHNIRCNGVSSGQIFVDETERRPDNPLGRHGRPDDIARVIAFLLSDESGWINGQMITANGGATYRE